MRKIYLLITSAMLLLCSSSAWAVDVVSYGGNTYVTPRVEGNDYSFDNEGDAIVAAVNTWKDNGGELRMLKDVNCFLTKSGGTMAVIIYANCTLDLNGKKLYVETDKSYIFYVNAKYENSSSILGSLTIKGDGTFEGSTSKDASSVALVYVNGKNQSGVGKLSSSLLIESGTFKMGCTGNESATCYDVWFGSNLLNTQINIAGGTFYDNILISANNPVYKPFSAGLFKNKPATANLKDCRSVTDEPDADGFYHVVEADAPVFAKIGTTEYSDVTEFNAALSEDESNPTTVILMPAQSCSPIVTIDAGKFINIKQPSTSTQNNVSIINNGTISFYDEGSQIMTWNNVTFENNGTIYLKKGDFTPSVFEYLTQSKDDGGVGASVPEGYVACNYTFLSNTYKRIYTTDEIVATITTDGNVNGYSSVATAINQSSEESPAVLTKDADLVLSMLNPLINDGGAKYLDLNGKTLTHSLSIKIFNGSLNIIGAGSINYTGTTSETELTTSLDNGVAFSLKGSNDATVTSYTALSIGKDVTVNALGGYGIGIFGSDSDTHSAYGVNVDIAGKINAKQMGVTINGGVNKISGAPVINVKNGAIINATCESGACIYAAGYGNWTIGAATLKASTPIYAKSGSIIVNGATIEACGEYAEPQPYGNGFYPTGDAIVFDSKNGYAGNMQLTITDAAITSANGYAVHEVMTDREESQTLVMQVAGGKFKGERGTIELTENFNESTPTRWAMNSITSGKYSYAPNEVADGYIVVLNTDDDKNEFPYKVVYDELTPTTIVEITENTTVDDVVTVAEDNALVVKSGVTYTVKGLVIGTGAGSKSKVTVEPGAKLIVGTNGIVNYVANQLVLEADKRNGTAILRFDGTTSNKQPYAKVELYMYAHQENGLNVWQHIGIPTAEAPEQIAKTAPYMFNTWNVNKGWQAAVQADVNSPWVGYNSSTNMGSEGSKLTFSGKLVGNANAEFVLVPNAYSCFANSYTDYTKIKDFISLFTEGETDGTVWVYGIDANGIVDFAKYNSSSFNFKPDPGFAPMQAFFIKNNTAAEIHKSVPYGTMGTTREAVANEFNGGIISIIGGGEKAELQIVEKEGLSDEMDYGYDSEQFATGTIQIYVKQGDKKLAAIGTNNINGKEIEIVTKSATEYTLKFEYLKGNAFKLKDLASGADVEVTEGGTYTFSAAANSTILRFKLGEGEVAANEADVESVSIWVAENVLNIAGAAEGDSIEIINLAGIKVLSATATGEAVQSISLSGIASGAYIVKAGAATVKVIK